MVKKEISSVRNWKEAFWETAMCSVTSSHRVTPFPSISLSLRLFFWNFKVIFRSPKRSRVKKEISFVKNWKEAVWETPLSSLYSSHGISAFPSRILSLRLSCGIWKVIFVSPESALLKKDVSCVKNWNEAFWETVLCSLISSQSYCFPLKKPFAKTVLVEFPKWYLEAHRGIWWKRKYLPLKTGKKLSEKHLCVLLIHLTELQLSPQEAFR